MQCPYCRTENRDERDVCYNCKKDLSTLRVVLAKAKQHFNIALEHAERGREEEAKAELYYALDLDESHVNSHIVLGTLYAKNKEFDKAEEHWHKALSIDPRYEKAHNYLEKLDSVRLSIPHAKQIRVMALLVVVLAIALVLSAIFSVRANPDQVLFEKMQELSLVPNYAEALAVGGEAALDKDSPFRVPLALLRNAILSSQTTTLNAIGNQLKDGQVAEARAAIETFAAQNPSKDIMQFLVVLKRSATTLERRQLLASADSLFAAGSLEEAHNNLSKLLTMNVQDEITSQALQVRSLMVEVARKNVRSCMANLIDGTTTLEAANNAIALCRKIGPASPDKADVLEEYLAAAELQLLNTDAQALLTALRKRLEEGKISVGDFLKSIINLRNAQSGNEELIAMIDEQVNILEKSLTDQVTNAIQNVDVELATKTLTTLKTVLLITRPDEAEDMIAEWAKKIGSADKTDLMAQFDKLDNSDENLEQVVDMGERIMARTSLSDIDRSRIGRRLKSANSKLAQKRWEWMETLDYKYEKNKLSEKELSQTIAWYDQIADHLPRLIYPSSHDNLLFYLAMAYRQKGDTDKAIELLSKLKAEYPNSNMILVVEDFLKKDAPEDN